MKAGVGEKNTRSRSRSKMHRLRNTDDYSDDHHYDNNHDHEDYAREYDHDHYRYHDRDRYYCNHTVEIEWPSRAQSGLRQWGESTVIRILRQFM